MGSKQKTRRRVEIENIPKRQKRDDFRECSTTGCHNVIAVWSKHRTCSLCRAGIQ